MKIIIEIPDELNELLKKSWVYGLGYSDKIKNINFNPSLKESPENSKLIPNPQIEIDFFKSKVIETIKNRMKNYSLEEFHKAKIESINNDLIGIK